MKFPASLLKCPRYTTKSPTCVEHTSDDCSVLYFSTNPRISSKPLVMGTPAICMLSFTATRLPLSLPEGAPLMSVRIALQSKGPYP